MYENKLLQTPKIFISKTQSNPLIRNSSIKNAHTFINPENRFDKYYKKVTQTAFDEKKTFSMKKPSNSNYSKSYGNFAKKKIFIEEKIREKHSPKSPKTINSKASEKSSKNSIFSNVNKDYSKTILKNNEIYINALSFENRTGISFEKKNSRPATASPKTVYQRIKREWVDEFFWKKINNNGIPLMKNKIKLQNDAVKEACQNEDFSGLKSYRAFNSQFMKKLIFLSRFKKDFEKINQKLEESFHNKSENSPQVSDFNICLNQFSKVLFDENLELKLNNFNYENNVIEKILIFQKFLTETLLKNNQENLAKISDLIFKMFCVLYENAHEI